jgi:3-hydroxyisobutyrate dehydrogenase-like beta-hydroxyacid dehydrogenase
LASSGIGYVDSPVSGGAAGARAGTLAVMISGADDDVDAVLPLLESLASRSGSGRSRVRRRP